MADEIRNACKGIQANPIQIAELERSLDSNPDDFEIRCKLLGHYMSNRFVDPAGQQKFQAHVLFTIQSFPESKIAGTQYAKLDRDLDGEAAYQAGKELWLKQIGKFPNNLLILRNAINYLERETDITESLKLQLLKIQSQSQP